MMPHAITEVPLPEVQLEQVIKLPPRPSSPHACSAAEENRASGGAFLKGALLESHRVKSSSQALDLLVAFTLHAIVIGVPILAGLMFTATLSPKEFATMMLVAPPPPPPPPPPAAAAIAERPAPRRVFTNEGKLLAPTVVPKEVAMIKEAPLEPDAIGGVAGGVPGGVPGGQMGGVLGGVLGGIPSTAKPIAAPVAHSKVPVRVGGRVRRPQAIRQVAPRYPSLARDAHVTGDVVIDAILDERGNVTEMKIISGSPLFYSAALAALREWKYEPTYLNDEAISVQLIVTISFRLERE
ncbi:MAG TPA: TonB family protein [Candidatus Cybelea sp.]|nr:TonB family protein [Candidatus Cybelea sp.]